MTTKYIVKDEEGCMLRVFWSKAEAYQWVLPGYVIEVKKMVRPDWYTLMLSEIGEARV